MYLSINQKKENEQEAKIAAVYAKRALHLFTNNEKNWQPQVLNISSIHKNGIHELIQLMEAYFLKIETSGFLNHNRKQQDLFWFEETILQELQSAFSKQQDITFLKKVLEEKITNNEINAVQAAKFLVEKFLSK